MLTQGYLLSIPGCLNPVHLNLISFGQTIIDIHLRITFGKLLVVTQYTLSLRHDFVRFISEVGNGRVPEVLRALLELTPVDQVLFLVVLIFFFI